MIVQQYVRVITQTSKYIFGALPEEEISQQDNTQMINKDRPNPGNAF